MHRIFQQYKKWVFLSPHFDDIPLAFGGFLSHVIERKIVLPDIEFQLIFSRSNYLAEDEMGNRDTSVSREQLATGTRLTEDVNCLEDLMKGQPFSYSLLRQKECVLRGKGFKEGEAFEFPFGNKDTFDVEDKKIYEHLKTVWSRQFNSPDVLVFCPIGMKEHVDHIIVRDSLLDAIKEKSLSCGVVFGEDLPYTGFADEKDWAVLNEFLKSIRFEEIHVAIDAHHKADLVMKHYVSQVTESYRKGVLNRAKQLSSCERLYFLL